MVIYVYPALAGGWASSGGGCIELSDEPAVPGILNRVTAKSSSGFWNSLST